MMPMRVLMLVPLISLCACAPAVEHAPGEPVPADRAPAAAVTGPALSCLETTHINATRVHGDRTIDFRVAGRRIYRNTLPYPCPELGFEERFAYSLPYPRLCSSDIITVLHSDGSRGASCGLGEFVPVDLARRDQP